MKRDVVTLPPSLLRAVRFVWDIDWRGQSAGASLTGGTTTVFNAAPRWVGQPVFAVNGVAIAQWRAVRAAARGRAHLYRLPLIDPIGARDMVPDLGADAARLGLPLAKGQRLANGAGIAWRPCLRCVGGGAAAGATDMVVDASRAPRPPYVGQILSHDYWPFVVTSVLPGSVADRYDITLEMPLRGEIPENDAVDLIAHGLFEATDDTSGPADYDRQMRARPQLSLVEALVR